MKRIADQLPPDVARLIHPDRRRNEDAYWAVRDQLLTQYRGLWIGFADGKIVASGTSPVDVFHASEATGLHPFFICVGHEDAPCRIRRQVFPYDANYPGESLPATNLEFRSARGVRGIVFERVIPDTGADASVLPWSDCEQLQLDPSRGVQSIISGIAGRTVVTLAFQTWVWLDGQEYPCRLQADFAGNDRILGRDVMNRLKVQFDGPNGEVVFNP